MSRNKKFSDDEDDYLSNDENNSEVFVVVPCFNEENTVGSIVEKLAKIKYKVVLVDDGSTDNSSEIVKKSKLKYPNNIFILHHAINRGLGNALKTGLTFSFYKNAKYAVTFDADGQHDIEDVKSMIVPLKNRKTQVVIGSRVFKDMPLTKRFANNVMNFITYLFYRIKVKDSQSGLRAFKSEAIPKLIITSPGYGVSSEFIREIHRNHLIFEEVTIKTIYTPETQNKGTNVFTGIKILFKMIFNTLK